MTDIVPYKETQIRYCDQGKGKTVVLLHGYLESLDTWEEYASDLAKHFRVVSIDLPGHGMSGCIGNAHTMEMMADAVLYILKGLEIDKCTMVGHSMGGYVTLAFAENYPIFLSAFCLFHSTTTEDTEEKQVSRNREIGMIKTGKKELIYNLHVPKTFANDNVDLLSAKVKLGKKIAKETDDQGIIAALEGMKLRPDRAHVLKQSKVPVLFILGKKDNFIPWDKMNTITRLPKKAEVLFLENSGHMGFFEEKTIALSGLINFVNKNT